MSYPIRRPAAPASDPPFFARLEALAHNLHWTWHRQTRELFRSVDPALWEASGQNPVVLLDRAGRRRLEELAHDGAFLSRLDEAWGSLQEYLGRDDTWYRSRRGPVERPCIAYFSMEFAVASCLPIYAGGLGILAGDHLKSASDLGVPLAGVGLLYQLGYFSQYLSRAGRQREAYAANDPHSMPLRLERTGDGAPLTVQVPCARRQIAVQVWKADVGRVPLYLLDANIPPNSPEDREITARLYQGDNEMRLRQELLLGPGGVRALHALGLPIAVCHLNEGHAAFAALERVRLLMSARGLSFSEAREAVRATTIFTTHTSVPAGIDHFGAPLLRAYFERYLDELGLTLPQLMALGRQDPAARSEPLNMLILALRLSGWRNAVSRLHGEVSRTMWQVVWPHLPPERVPIAAITNGVHLESWLAEDTMAALFDRYLGAGWRRAPCEPPVWDKVADIPDEELWRAHEQCRRRLVDFARRRASPGDGAEQGLVLDPNILTIGFARRFVPYKRADLLLGDMAFLRRLLAHPKHPVQLIFAGKAHPRDSAGKRLLHRIVSTSKLPELQGRLVFLEDYDVDVARYLVQGTDIWLNTPQVPREACGTSGMKAALNGVLNMSTLDGWWPEAYRPEIGWAIGSAAGEADPQTQDAADRRSLHHLLKREAIPLFYKRGSDGLPHAWIARMKASIREVGPRFSSEKMVRYYCEQAYDAAVQESRRLGLWAETPSTPGTPRRR